MGEMDETRIVENETQIAIDAQTKKPKGFTEGLLAKVWQRKPLRVALIGFFLILAAAFFLKIAIQARKSQVPAVAGKENRSNERIPLPALNGYGYTGTTDQTHPDKAIFTFAGEPGKAELTFTVGGIDTLGEVAVILNETKIIDAPLAIGRWGEEQTIDLPMDLIVRDGVNTIVFDNVMNPPQKEDWGVKSISVKFYHYGDCDVAEGLRLFKLGEERFTEKAVSDGNAYLAYKYFRDAIARTDACATPPDFLKKAEEKMALAREEFETRYRYLNFSYRKAFKMKNYPKVRADLEAIMRLIPDEKDKRYMEAEHWHQKLKNAMGWE